VSDLLPCHHCGSVDVRRDLNIDIWCDDCGATAPEAVWNRRAKPVIDDEARDDRLESETDYFFKGINEVVNAVQKVLDGKQLDGGTPKVLAMCDKIAKLKRLPVIDDEMVTDDVAIFALKAWDSSLYPCAMENPKDDELFAMKRAIKAALAVLSDGKGE